MFEQHHEVQKLQWEIQEIFILAYQRNYTAERVMDILRCMFTTREEEELDKKFWEKHAKRFEDEEILFI